MGICIFLLIIFRSREVTLLLLFIIVEIRIILNRVDQVHDHNTSMDLDFSMWPLVYFDMIL